MYDELNEMLPSLEKEKEELEKYINNNRNIIGEIIIERINMPIEPLNDIIQLQHLYNMCYSKFCDYRALKNLIAINQIETIDLESLPPPKFTYQPSSSSSTFRCAALGRQCSVGINSQLTSDNCTESMYNGNNECYICMKNKANVIFLDCHHINICNECLDNTQEYIQNGAKLYCPLCKDTVKNTITIDKSHLIDNYKCIKCENKSANIVFTHCGHIMWCKVCCNENKHCPICNTSCETIELQFSLI